MKHIFTFLLLLTVSAGLRAQIVFDGSPGGGAPPPTLGGYTMTPIVDNRNSEITTTSVPSPLGGSISFTPSLTTYRIAESSFNWGNGYTGLAYNTTGTGTSIVLTFPANTSAFYFYALPVAYNVTIDITARAQNNLASGTVRITAAENNPAGSAKYIGFYVNRPGFTIQTITVTVPAQAQGFFVGQFGISNCRPVIPTLTASNNGVITCTNPSLTLTAGGGNNYTFTGPGLNQTGASTTASISQPGTYRVTVAGASGCPSSSTTTTVTSNTVTPQNVTLSNDGPLTCTQTSVNLSAGSSTAGVTYAFSGPGVTGTNGSTATVNQEGTYTVKVTGTNGCTASQSTQVTSNTTPPAATLSNNGPLSCTMTTVTLTASGGSSYTFTDGSGTVLAGTGNTRVVSSPGLYSVTVASASGCASTTTTSVTSNTNTPAATLLASPSTTLTCAQTSVTLTAGGGDTYRFSPNVASQSGNKAIVNVADIYSVTVTNGSTGCSSATSITIGQDNTAPPASLTNNGPLSCTLTSVTLTASGGGSYQFSGGATQIDGGNTATVTTGGSYSVTVTGTNGCTATAQTTVSQDNAAPTASLVSSGTLSCGATSVTLTASPAGQQYQFSAGAAPIGSTNQAVVSSSGPYSVTVLYTNGCSSVASTSVSQDNSAPVASLASSETLSCTVTEVTLTASPSGSTGQTYHFSAGAIQIGLTNQATVTSAGLYSVTVVYGNGCSSVASVSVSQDNAVPQVSISANPSLTIAPGMSTTLAAQVSGGTAPFTYGWTTGATSPSIVAGTGGTYSVTATGDNGCSATASTTVTVSGPFAITGVTTVNCSPIQPNRFSLSFTPRYQGLDGSPVSFSVTNELFPTTEPGPYTLQLYSDNPVITLNAVQSGVSSRFAYNWLEACNSSTNPNTPPRVAMGIPSQTATVGQYVSYVIPEGTFTDEQTPGSLKLSASGVPPGLSFTGATLSGTPSTTVDSPYSVTITATDPGSLSASTSFQVTVLPASGTPPPTAPFAITGVSTIRCTPVANRINLVFSPRYAGMSGQPIALEVVNELAPTTDPAPYSLTLYRDNPVITLRATQTGSPGPVSFSYNWLAACSSAGQENTPPRLNEPVGPQSATVGVAYSLNLTNTFTDQETPSQISLSAAGLPMGLKLSGNQISGTPSMSGVSSVTLTATDGGGLSTPTSFTITVQPGAATPPPNPAGPFSITGVTTVNCEVISADQRRVTFTPRYAGQEGSPISFSVVNELAPTTASGPYSLNLYTDNPTITLSAVQSGVSSRFSYNWLTACNANGRQGAAEVSSSLRVTVLGNPVKGQQVGVEVRGAEGQPLQLSLTDQQGRSAGSVRIEGAGSVERQTLPLTHPVSGLLLLRVSTPTQSQTLKLIKAD